MVEECFGYYRGTNNWPVVRSNRYVTTLFLFSRNMYLGKESFLLVFVFVFLNSKEVLAQYKGTCKPTTMSTIRSHFSSLRERFLRFASECSGPCDWPIVFESLWKWTHSLNAKSAETNWTFPWKRPYKTSLVLSFNQDLRKFNFLCLQSMSLIVWRSKWLQLIGACSDTFTINWITSNFHFVPNHASRRVLSVCVLVWCEYCRKDKQRWRGEERVDTNAKRNR